MDDNKIETVRRQIWADLIYLLNLYGTPPILEIQQDFGNYEVFLTAKKKRPANDQEAA